MSNSINYNHLFALNAVDSFPLQRISEKEKHDIFMKSYPSIFKKRTILPGIPSKTTMSFALAHPYYQNKPASRFGGKRPQECYANEVNESNSESRTSFRSVEKAMIYQRQLKYDRLIEILHKLPFERSRKEQHETYHLITTISPTDLKSIIPNHGILKELCKVATLEKYKESRMTVFGNSGLHIILKGSVTPQTVQYVRTAESISDDEFPCPTPLLKRRTIKLIQGDCFGTVKKVEGREPNSKVLSVLTKDDCLLMKISISDYKRIYQKFYEKLEQEKTELIHSCALYKQWPRLSIRNLASLLEWKHFPADHVIINEGEVAPFMAFIKQGECEVFKAVDAIKTLPNKKRVQIHKQVCMNMIKPGESFGEYSVVTGNEFTCSVVSITPLCIGYITLEKFEELDETTKTLFIQTMKPVFVDTTEDDIQQEFIKQEMESDWNFLKHKVLLQTINWCGIRPGYGKWAH